MNNRIKREIKSLPVGTIEEIRKDYRDGTGLALLDLSSKYSLSFSACFYIVKANNLNRLLRSDDD